MIIGSHSSRRVFAMREAAELFTSLFKAKAGDLQSFCDEVAHKLMELRSVGDYIGPHCIKSLLSVYGERLAAGRAWGRLCRRAEKSVKPNMLGHPFPRSC